MISRRNQNSNPFTIVFKSRTAKTIEKLITMIIPTKNRVRARTVETWQLRVDQGFVRENAIEKTERRRLDAIDKIKGRPKIETPRPGVTGSN